jgi:hypothetical protein
MPVDELLRSAFDEHDDSWDLEVTATLARVHEKAHRGAVVRRRVAAGAIAAVLVPTALLTGWPEPTLTNPPASAPTSPSPSPGTPPTSAAQQLDGVWRTDPVTETDVRRTLAQAGLGSWSAPVLTRLPERPFVAELRIDDRRLNLRLTGPDGRPRHYDGQHTNVVGDQLRLTAVWSRVASGFRWSTEVRGTGAGAVTALSLELEATTEHVRGGIPGEVWMRVLYTSTDFVGAGKGLDGQTQ